MAQHLVRSKIVREDRPQSPDENFINAAPRTIYKHLLCAQSTVIRAALPDSADLTVVTNSPEAYAGRAGLHDLDYLGRVVPW